MTGMRWQQLFEDLAAQQAALELRERDAEIAEHTRAELGQVDLVGRLGAACGRRIRVGVRGAGQLEGALGRVGADWILLHVPGAAGGELFVPTAALTSVEGLPHRSEPDPAVPRPGLRQALRTLSRDRSRVRVHDVTGEHRTGTVDAVLLDHLDLARHADDEPRRSSAVRGRVSVPFAALALVRRL